MKQLTVSVYVLVTLMALTIVWQVWDVFTAAATGAASQRFAARSMSADVRPVARGTTPSLRRRDDGSAGGVGSFSPSDTAGCVVLALPSADEPAGVIAVPRMEDARAQGARPVLVQNAHGDVLGGGRAASGTQERPMVVVVYVQP